MTTSTPALQQLLADLAVAEKDAQAVSDSDAAAAVAAATAAAATIADVRSQLNTASAGKAADDAAIVVLQKQLDDAHAALAAATAPKPGPVLFGVSMNGTTLAEADQLHASLGATAMRIYDGGAKGPVWLRDQIKASGLLTSGYRLHLSWHLSSGTVPQRQAAVTSFTVGKAAAAVYDAVNEIHSWDVDVAGEHEPDQGDRIPPAVYWPFAQKLRAMHASTAGKAKLWLCLTGTAPARAAQWWTGKGVLDGIAFDNYFGAAGLAAELAAFVAAVQALDPALSAAVWELGPFKDKAPDDAFVESMIAALADPALAKLPGLRAVDWYNATVGAGRKLDDPGLVAAFKKAVTPA